MREWATSGRILLAAANLALIAILLWELDHPPGGSPLPPVAPVSPAHTVEPTLPTSHPAPRTRYRAIVERPLFEPSRRPPQPALPVTAAAPPAREPTQYRLSAVVIHGEHRTAIFQRRSSGETVPVAEGERLETWTLASLHADRATLTKDGQEITLQLRPHEPRAHTRENAFGPLAGVE